MTLHRTNPVRLILAGLTFGLTAAPPAAAQVVIRTYAAGMDSTWNVNEHWLPWGVPNNAGSVEYRAVINDGHIVSLDMSATVTELVLSSGSQLWIGNGRTLSLWGATDEPDGCTVYNDGTLRLAAENTNTRIHINQGPVMFSSTVGSGGEVVMDAGTGAGFSEIFGTGSSATRLINDAPHIFRGAGFFQSSLSLTNHGLISADQAGKALEIRVWPMTSGGDCTNDGVLRAENDATLKLLRSAPGFAARYINTDGVIEALDGSTVHLDSQTVIEGGELRTEGSGVLRVLGSSCLLKNIANQGTLRLNQGATLDIAGQIVNSGTIWIDSVAPGGGGLQLTSEGNVILSGGGVIELGNNLNNFIAAGASNRRLTNEDNTIRGAGQIGFDGLSFTNRGIIEASSTVTVIRLDPPSTGDFTNEGTLHALAAPGLIINAGPFITTAPGQVIVNTGSTLSRTGTYQQNGGSTMVNGTLTITSGALALAGGSLRGGGTISASGGVSNTGGSIEPGTSTGILSITGSLTQTAGGSVSVELRGTTPGSGHDRLAVTGAVSLNGTLNVTLIGGFVPESGDTFTILTSGSAVTGTFAAVNPPGPFTVMYLPNAVVLGVASPPCPADCASPADDQVAVSDLLALLAQWGGSGPCDLAAPVGVDVGDLLALLAAWGVCP
jgi:hypothetical protein